MGYRDVVVTYEKTTDPNSRLDSPLRPKTLCEVWRYLFRDKRVRHTGSRKLQSRCFDPPYKKDPHAAQSSRVRKNAAPSMAARGLPRLPLSLPRLRRIPELGVLPVPYKPLHPLRLAHSRRRRRPSIEAHDHLILPQVHAFSPGCSPSPRPYSICPKMAAPAAMADGARKVPCDMYTGRCSGSRALRRVPVLPSPPTWRCARRSPCRFRRSAVRLARQDRPRERPAQAVGVVGGALRTGPRGSHWRGRRGGSARCGRRGRESGWVRSRCGGGGPRGGESFASW